MKLRQISYISFLNFYFNLKQVLDISLAMYLTKGISKIYFKLK